MPLRLGVDRDQTALGPVPLNIKTKYSCKVAFKGKTPGGLAQSVRATDAGPRVY